MINGHDTYHPLLEHFNRTEAFAFVRLEKLFNKERTASGSKYADICFCSVCGIKNVEVFM